MEGMLCCCHNTHSTCLYTRPSQSFFLCVFIFTLPPFPRSAPSDRTTWTTRSAAWYLCAQPPTRPSPCSSSWPRLSRETSLRWPWKRTKKWWANEKEGLNGFRWNPFSEVHTHTATDTRATDQSVSSSREVVSVDDACVSQVTEIRLKYFDTIPVATAMCVLKTGFLFVSSEFGNQ